jgi:hypothetical protein
MKTYKEFTTITAAKAYRYTNGTGGWIFARQDNTAVLFPPDMTPSDIFHHPLTRGTSGELLGNA